MRIVSQGKWKKIRKYLSVEYKFFSIMSALYIGFSVWRIYKDRPEGADNSIRSAIIFFAVALIFFILFLCVDRKVKKTEQRGET